MSIVARGLGLGAAAIIVTAGLGLAQQVEQPPSTGGGGAFAARIAAPQQEQHEAQRAGEEQSAKTAGTAPAARQGSPQFQPAAAPTAPQATPVPAGPQNVPLARSEQPAAQFDAAADANDQAAADQTAADRTKDRQRRIAIALALLMLEA